MKRIPDEVSGSAGPTIENWVRSFWSTSFDSPDLPPHHPDCLGCGPQNPHGHALSVQRDENGVVAHHVFDQRHVGAPGIAHGGAVATVLDDLFGFLLYTVGELAVTRRLELDYLAPVLLGTPYVLRAAVRSRDGRKLDLTATMDDAQGRSVATPTALFVVVEVEHFMQSQARAQLRATDTNHTEE
ncbi:MAG: PaaI family thioesterase [Rhodococcus sp.]|nr:PaaI family thioesterase [Rhodococcus sp. (in: high G+C Gram-positive bacteria)]